jgi:predicted transcriptional regulator
MKPLIRTSVQLEKVDIAKMKKLAEEMRTSYSSLIRQAIAEFLRRKQDESNN